MTTTPRLPAVALVPTLEAAECLRARGIEVATFDEVESVKDCAAVIVTGADDAERAALVVESRRASTRSTKLLTLPATDVLSWFADGGSIEKLHDLSKKTPRQTYQGVEEGAEEAEAHDESEATVPPPGADAAVQRIAYILSYRPTDRAGQFTGTCADCGDDGAWLDSERHVCAGCGERSIEAMAAHLGLWPDEPDVPGIATPEPLPVDALPPAYAAHVRSVARSLQVPADLPLMLGLGTVSAAVAGRVEVRVRDEWTEPVGIYTACILPPASRKSPAYAAMTAPLREWEAEEVRRQAALVLAARDVVDVAEKNLERLKGEAAKPPPKGKARPSPDEIEHARNELEAARAKVPPDGRILAGDITPEAMVQRMAAQGGRLAILEPEPGPLQLLAGLYSKTARLDELKKAWSREALTVDRVGRAPLRVSRPALTLALCLQPGVLSRLENREAFRGEGVLGRILWCQPPHGLGSRRTGSDVPAMDERAAREVVRIVRMLCALGPADVEDDGTERAHVVRLSAAALDVLHAYEAELEPELADGARLEAIRDWAGKACGQAVRVAALLELAARAEDGRPLTGEPIGPWAMESAVRLMRALTTHALAVLAPMDGRSSLLAYVLRRAVELPQGSTLRDLYERTKGRAAIESMTDLEPLVTDLAERGCLRLQLRPSSGGRPPSPVVEIHPALTESIRKSRTSTPTEPEQPTSATSANVSGSPTEETGDPLDALAEART